MCKTIIDVRRDLASAFAITNITVGENAIPSTLKPLFAFVKGSLLCIWLQLLIHDGARYDSSDSKGSLVRK